MHRVFLFIWKRAVMRIRVRAESMPQRQLDACYRLQPCSNACLGKLHRAVKAVVIGDCKGRITKL
jgi:hypothetical protein